MNKAIFLDKDGTIFDNSEYPHVIPSDKILHDEVIEGLKLIPEKPLKNKRYHNLNMAYFRDFNALGIDG